MGSSSSVFLLSRTTADTEEGVREQIHMSTYSVPGTCHILLVNPRKVKLYSQTHTASERFRI